MPKLTTITGKDDGELSAAETNYVRRILRKGSTVTPPSANDVDVAIATLEGEQRQELRSLFDSYGAIGDGEEELSGGSDGLTYAAVIERWGVRNDVRVLLGFTEEPRPTAGSDGIQFISFSLPLYASSSDEFGG